MLDIKDIELKAEEFRPLWERQDKDKDHYWLKPYEMKMIEDDTKAVPRIVNLTLNDPATFAFRSIAILSSANPQTIVEGEHLGDDFTNYIERCLNDFYLTIDETLAPLQLWLYPYVTEQSCVRGWLAAQNLTRKGKDGKIIVDVRPLDTRYQIYDMGIKNLNWHAYITRKTRSYILERFKHDIGESKRTEIVYDCYDKKRHYGWLGGGTDVIQVEDSTHPFANENNGEGYVPVVMQKVPSGSMLADEDNIAHDGESIFALDRNLYPEMNRLATILHNLTVASFFGALQYASEAGEKKRVSAPPYGLGVVVAVEKGGGYQLIPVNDIRNATRLEYSMLESRLQRGSLPNIDYGNLSFPLSAVAIARLTESKDQIFVPRLQCFAMFYRQLSQMFIKQLLMFNKPVELGEEGHRRTYEPSKLKGEYAISYKYFSESKEQRLANLTEAQASRGLLSDDYIRREIMHHPNPDEEMNKLRDEQAEKADPAVGLYRRVHSLIDAAHNSTGQVQKRYDMEARLTLRTLILMLKQSSATQALQFGETARRQRGQGEQQAKQIMPLLEAGGGRTRQGETEEEVNESILEEERISRLAETGRQGREQEALVTTPQNRPKQRRAS